MTEKYSAGKTGRPAKVPGEKHTREKIFDAAVDLFAERGFDRTSVRDIAKAVGVTESAVYRHYPGKDAILEAIFVFMENRVYTPLSPVHEAGELDNRTIFRDMLEGLPRFIMADPVLVKTAHIMFTEMYHNEKIRDYVKKEYGKRADDYTEKLFRKHVMDGTIRPCDTRALAILFNSFRFAWMFKTFILDYGEPMDIGKMEKSLQAPIKLFEDLLKSEHSLTRV
ncbi:TetR/AcrR family transcriptional regulator [Methanosphaerula palustris]|uniref:Transcriptional regulator, TetR family n=1 Tax=Methanosphaerula palustris (strain ATCC BAA-1556 / DSM 19958 / E1-9c) TaxID=521011 RepID=B8GGG0_METPE|nr:TetR/AcrR family transcriptional regulator [Methanosphaerula palustris]ACL16215.1 transcriptional regulator, TetR family [Methanosphaerula palustris E1-9c]